MKKRALILITVLLSFQLAHAAANGPVDPVTRIQGTFATVFQALQSGDVQTLKSHMAGHMYEQYKVLLEENLEYPSFLKNFYRGATFSVTNIVYKGDDALVDVVITFSGGNKTVTKMLLKQDSNQMWKLTEVVHTGK